MRKYLSSKTLAVFFLVASGGSAATLTMAPVSLKPGASADASLVLQTDGALITQIQFNLDYDTANLRINAEADSAALKANKDLSVSGATYMIIGLNQTAIADGKLVLFHISAKSDANGAYPLRFSKLVASDKDGQPIGLTAADVTLTVGNSVGPQITKVVNGASFEAGIAAATWVTIFGSNLSSTTRIWGSQDFAGNKLPTSLDGVQVLINGKPAYIYFVSPTQLNVLAPDDDVTGQATVQVLTPQGQSSVTTTPKTKTAPGFFMLDPEGRKYVAAFHADGSLVAKAGLYAGVQTRPAAPGETITLYGTGFGAPGSPAPAGQIVAAPIAMLGGAVSIRFAGDEGTVVWAGLIGSGLYQVNVRIPVSAKPGDVNVVAQTGGASSSAGAFISISQ